VITTLLAPVLVGIAVGWQEGASPLLGFALLLGAFMLTPHVLIMIYVVAFALGKLLGVLGARHVAFYTLGGIAVAWLFFLLFSVFENADNGPSVIAMMIPVQMPDGLACFCSAGALNGVIYWWIANMRLRRAITARSGAGS